MAIADPYTRIHRAIWTALLASAEWKNLVPAGSRVNTIDETRARDFARGERTPQEYGGFKLEQGRFSHTPFGVNSKVTSGSETFVAMIESGDKENSQKINALKWATFRALQRSGDDLGIRGLVRDWRITDSMDAPNPPASAAGAGPGYAAVFSIVVDFDVPRSEVITPPL
jgi:hypothetical protein